MWVAGNYDPETNLAYWGTGNGGPWMGDQRPGDNLYTSSTIAVDVATGQITSHFQSRRTSRSIGTKFAADSRGLSRGTAER